MIAIGSDHRGYSLKESIKKHLEEKGIKYLDCGTDSEERVDSLPIVAKLCKAVQNKECEKGILICGTGLAMTITANKYKRIMCAPCYSELSSERSRQHNDANVLALGAELVDSELGIKIVDIFLNTEHLGGKYAERVKMIEDLEDQNMK